MSTLWRTEPEPKRHGRIDRFRLPTLRKRCESRSTETSVASINHRAGAAPRRAPKADVFNFEQYWFPRLCDTLNPTMATAQTLTSPLTLPCQDRRLLEKRMANAISAVYLVKALHMAGEAGSASEFTRARQGERNAEQALQAHVEEHGCQQKIVAH